MQCGNFVVLIGLHISRVANNNNNNKHQQMKERLKQEYSRRLRIILKSELNARNKITAIAALAVPVLW